MGEIDEDWTTPVDTRMEAIGGSVFRRTLSDVKQTIHEENVAARCSRIGRRPRYSAP